MKKLFVATLFAVAIVLSSCTETTTTSSGAFGSDSVTERTPIFSQLRQPNVTEGSFRNAAVRRGTDQFFDPSALTSNRHSKAEIKVVNDKKVEINLVNASIEAAASAVLGDALGKQFVVADGLNGRITIQTTGAVPKSALLDLFEAALAANRIKLESTGGIIRLLPGTTGNTTFALASSSGVTEASIVVAPLEFISAKQMVQLLSPLIEDGLTAVPDAKRNLVLMTGSVSQLEGAIDALNLFDVDVLAGRSVALVKLNAAEPEEVVQELQTIFSVEQGGSLEGVVEFVPNNRLGSILVITSRARYLAEAERWIRDLDRTAGTNRRYSQIYSLENRSATALAPVLSELLSGLTEDSGENQDSSTSGANVSRVAADDERNALVVRALRIEHEEIRRLLVQLDSSPRQVLLEATIAEVSLNDQVSLGVRWFFEAGNFDNTFTDTNSGSAGPEFPGFSAVFSTSGITAALNALAGVTDLKVISSPTLMVLDNKEAILQIGDQVPIAVQTSTDNSIDAATVTTIDYRDTGVILSVKPRIGASGLVVLDVKQEISDVAQTNTSGIDSPTIRQRQIETSVVLRDGSTLVLGGLVQEGDRVTVTKVPGLGDVPIVGTVFKSKSSSKDRSELLILIRPRVIETAGDAREITRLWRQKLSGANSLLDNGLGTARHTVEDILQ